MAQYHAAGDYPSSKRNEDDNRKLFVGGLKWETTKDDLQQYFEQFGEVTYANIKTEPSTQKSRGFGFVTFAEEAALLKVLQQTHELDGKTIDPKRAKSRNLQDSAPVFKVLMSQLFIDIIIFVSVIVLPAQLLDKLAVIDSLEL